MNVRKLLAALCVLTMIITGLGLAIALFRQQDAGSATSSTSLSPPTAPAPRIPTPQEFRVGVEVTAQRCADTGTCTYTYTIQPMYVGKHPLPDQDFAVFYEIIGGKETQSGDFTVSDGQTRVYTDVTIEAVPGAQLQATVTRISPRTGPTVPGSSSSATP